MLKFDHVYELPPEEAEHYLAPGAAAPSAGAWGRSSTFADMVDEHWLGIVRWFDSRITNGLLEGLNSLVQAAKRRARGYRSTRNYIAMIYLTVGKLDTRRHPHEVARSRGSAASDTRSRGRPGSRRSR